MNYYFKVLKNYAVFTGRARRSEYWYFSLWNAIILYGLIFIEFTFSNLPFAEWYFSGELLTVHSIYGYAIWIPSLAVLIRRMHDVGKSGWYCLIPIYNIILACRDSQWGINKYGENPKIENDDMQQNSDVVYCPKDGVANLRTSKFCKNCGTSLS